MVNDPDATPVPTADRRPPAFAIEGLWQVLSRLDQVLARATAAADAASGSGPQAEPYRGLYITGDEVRRMLKREPGQPLLAGGDGGRPLMPAASRFPWLERQFELTSFDLDVILIALAPEVDLRYERVYAYLHDDITRRRPSVELALNLLSSTREAKILARGRFAPDAPLIRRRLLHLVSDSATPPPLLAQQLKLDDSIVRFLLGAGGLDVRLQPFARLESVGQEGRPNEGHWGYVVDLAAAASRKADAHAHFYFEGAVDAAEQTVARGLGARLAVPVLTANLGKAAAAPHTEFETTMAVLFREALFLNAVLVLEDFESLRAADRGHHLQTLSACVEDSSSIVIFHGDKPCDPRFRTVSSVILAKPDFDERVSAWTAALESSRVPVDSHVVEELASRYLLSADQIQSGVKQAVRQAALQSEKPREADLAQAARIQSQRDLGSLASQIRPVYRWPDLVLPPDHVKLLKELCRQARYRHVVLGEWGFESRLSLGKGLSALFSGPPGTGKTMAVEVIANDLGLDLYRIDLSQVVSKYIGETEKNLDRLFREARAGNVILFFDECDALFGKRTAVQDAHDRYANLEIAYLLQKMDEHEGVSILATNLRQNLDAAFVRRLTFIVEFPFPDESSRRRIWQRIWPKNVPRSSDLDLDFMAAQFKLPGGAVKNIAVAAAYLAAAEEKKEKRVVTTEHLLWATRRELEKSGRGIPRSEFGRYIDRLEAMAAAGERK